MESIKLDKEQFNKLMEMHFGNHIILILMFAVIIVYMIMNQNLAIWLRGFGAFAVIVTLSLGIGHYKKAFEKGLEIKI